VLPEDVGDVLSRMTSTVRHGGSLLDLQAIERPLVVRERCRLRALTVV
jgi:hypothetical protein